MAFRSPECHDRPFCLTALSGDGVGVGGGCVSQAHPSSGSQHGYCAHSKVLRGSSTPAARTSVATAAAGVRRRSCSIQASSTQFWDTSLQPGEALVTSRQPCPQMLHPWLQQSSTSWAWGTSPVTVGAVNHKMLVIGRKWLCSREACDW